MQRRSQFFPLPVGVAEDAELWSLPGETRWFFVCCLTLAHRREPREGQHDLRGCLTPGRGLPYTPETLAKLFGRTTRYVRRHLTAARAAGLIDTLVLPDGRRFLYVVDFANWFDGGRYSVTEKRSGRDRKAVTPRPEFGQAVTEKRSAPFDRKAVTDPDHADEPQSLVAQGENPACDPPAGEDKRGGFVPSPGGQHTARETTIHTEEESARARVRAREAPETASSSRDQEGEDGREPGTTEERLSALLPVGVPRWFAQDLGRDVQAWVEALGRGVTPPAGALPESMAQVLLLCPATRPTPGGYRRTSDWRAWVAEQAEDRPDEVTCALQETWARKWGDRPFPGDLLDDMLRPARTSERGGNPYLDSLRTLKQDHYRPQEAEDEVLPAPAETADGDEVLVDGQGVKRPRRQEVQDE